jgi:hypothetical protein
MKTIIKLLIVAAILNASARAGMAAYAFFQLKDTAQELARFGDDTPVNQLQGAVMEKATELKLPIEPEQVTVSRQGVRTLIEVSYIQPIELFPNYIYPQKFEFSVDGFKIAGISPPSRRK